jgi:protein-disulfide isomerase
LEQTRRNSTQEFNMTTPDIVDRPSRVPAGASENGDGIAVGTGPVTVDAYIDFICPFCRTFEEENGPAIDSLVDRGLITLVYHPLGFLDRLSTTRYSTRAAAASGCASDGDHFRPYVYALYENQPAEGSAGLSAEQLLQVGVQGGLGQDFSRCVFAAAYTEWAEYVTAQAIAGGVSGTPSVYVDGIAVPATAQAIASAARVELG